MSREYTFTRDAKGEITGIVVPANRPFKVIFIPSTSMTVPPTNRSKKPKKQRINPNPEQYTKTEHWNVGKQVFEVKPILSYDSLMLALSRKYKVGMTKVKMKGGFFELLKNYGYIIRERKGFYRLENANGKRNVNSTK